MLGVAPVSGALLDMSAYSVQPTLLASSVDLGPRVSYHNIQGGGMVYPIPGGIEIGPGAGVAMIQVAAVITPIMDISVTWLEDWMDF